MQFYNQKKRMVGPQKSSYGTLAEDRVEDNWSASSSSLRIILVGRSGSGKSATGNSILCQPQFESRLGAQSVTKKCQAATGSWNGRSVLVVDTAPIFDTEAQNPESYQDIGHCYLLSAPGPHVLLLVTQLGRFTAQDVAAARRVKEVFGAEAMRHVILLFTRREDLGGGSLRDFVATTDNLSLRSLVRECDGRCCAFDNRATGAGQRGQLEELMAVVESLERARQGAFLSNHLFSEAQMLQRDGGGARGGGSEHYLAQVRAQVAKHRRDLEERERNPALRALLGAKKWILLNTELCVCVVWCSLLILLILLIICYHV